MLRKSKYVLTVPLSEGEYLFVNTFTGDMISGTRDLLKVFKGGLESCDTDVVSSLVTSGFLTELTPKEETASVFEALQSIRKVYKEHTLFLFILTYNCNMRCTYCFESYLFEKEEKWLQKRMSFNQVDAAFEAMEKLTPDALPVHLFGGEPFLVQNYDLVRYVLEKGTDLGKSFSAITNGLETYQFIPLLMKADIQTLQITLDGAKEVHDTRKKTCEGAGTFHQIVKSIDQLVEAGIHVTVKVTFDHSTVRELPHFMEFAKMKGWVDTEHVSVYASPVFHHSKGGCYNFLCNLYLEDVEFLLTDSLVRTAFLQGMNPLIQKLGFKDKWVPQVSYCRHLPSQTYFDPFGDIYLCDDSLGDCEHAVGTYYPELQFNEQYYTWKKRTIFDMKSCHHCKYAMICAGGCGHYTYHEKGSLLEPDCTFPRQAITVYYPLIWKMIQKYGERQLEDW
ncbi:MAG: hypothetical protein AYK19_10610 [Theionarchaea archaeon DG-70-1]|nr:MAG: hypothetical protein AYK19_10610 [Theionarchaea archaeon DG-70-1]